MDDPKSDTSNLNNVNDDKNPSPVVVGSGTSLSSSPVATGTDKTNSPLVVPTSKEQGGAKMDTVVGGIDVQKSDETAKKEGDEYWESYAREIELEKQVAEMGGVEKVDNGEVQIPKEVAKEMGIEQVTNAQTPISNVSGFSVSGTTLTDDQLTTGLTKPTSSGFKWLAEWFIYQLLKAHFHIKKVGGKILRTKN